MNLVDLRPGDLVAVRVDRGIPWKRAVVLELNSYSAIVVLNDQSELEVLRIPSEVRPIRLAYCRPRAELRGAS